MNPADPKILLTIDVEDWFQVENFKQWIPFSSWDSQELRVEKNVHRLLDLFDSIEPKSPKSSASLRNSIKPNDQQSVSSVQYPASISVKVTFFILGWISERLPRLIREIHARGHEVASHGINHDLCNKLAKKDLKNDLDYSKKLLEDIIGDRVYGFRAPSFAINYDILKAIQECGYLYDSSYNSFKLHGRYGQMNFSQNEKKGIAIRIPIVRNSAYNIQQSETSIFYELPISNFKIGNVILPFGGGGYFRLIPLVLFKKGVRKILKKEDAFLFYSHPWEIDPMQPKVKHAFLTYKFRHYNNLKNTYSKLSNMIKIFQNCKFVSCSKYLNSQI